jgi:ankyrin repeat protein
MPNDLIDAASRGDAKKLKALIEKGAEVNAPVKDLGTPLMAASYLGHIAAAQVLLESGADVNAKRSHDGVTALMQACINGHAEVVRMLLDSRADVNVAKTNDGKTALKLACTKGDPGVIQALLDKGADAEVAPKPVGETALMSAALNDRRVVVSVLLKNGANVNAKRTCDGMTALMLASFHGHPEVIKALLEKGADVNLKNNHGHTAGCASLASLETEVIVLLMQAGSKLCAECKTKELNMGANLMVTGSGKTYGENWDPDKRAIVDALNDLSTHFGCDISPHNVSIKFFGSPGEPNDFILKVEGISAEDSLAMQRFLVAALSRRGLTV